MSNPPLPHSSHVIQLESDSHNSHNSQNYSHQQTPLNIDPIPESNNQVCHQVVPAASIASNLIPVAVSQTQLQVNEESGKIQNEGGNMQTIKANGQSESNNQKNLDIQGGTEKQIGQENNDKQVNSQSKALNKVDELGVGLQQNSAKQSLKAHQIQSNSSVEAPNLSSPIHEIRADPVLGVGKQKNELLQPFIPEITPSESHLDVQTPNFQLQSSHSPNISNISEPSCGVVPHKAVQHKQGTSEANKSKIIALPEGINGPCQSEKLPTGNIQEVNLSQQEQQKNAIAPPQLLQNTNLTLKQRSSIQDQPIKNSKSEFPRPIQALEKPQSFPQPIQILANPQKINNSQNLIQVKYKNRLPQTLELPSQPHLQNQIQPQLQQPQSTIFVNNIELPPQPQVQRNAPLASTNSCEKTHKNRDPLRQQNTEQSSYKNLTDINQIRKLLMTCLPPEIVKVIKGFNDEQLMKMYNEIQAEQVTQEQKKSNTSKKLNNDPVSQQQKKYSSTAPPIQNKGPSSHSSNKESQGKQSQSKQSNNKQPQGKQSQSKEPQTKDKQPSSHKSRKKVVTTIVQQIQYLDQEPETRKLNLTNNGEIRKQVIKKKNKSYNKQEAEKAFGQICSLIKSLDVSMLKE